MKTLDLKRTPSFKIKREITAYCGGERTVTRFADLFKKGMGGLIFRDAGANNQPYSAILATFQDGMGIYCRNVYSNYLVLVPASEIQTIEIQKKADIIQPKKFSLYTLLKKTGLKHHQIFGYLMPNEWVKTEPATCTIHTPDTYFSLELVKCAPESLVRYLLESPVGDKLIPSVDPPEFL